MTITRRTSRQPLNKVATLDFCPSSGSLWCCSNGHNLCRNALHGLRVVLLFFPVPPSLRQAAGPLTENLPNVSAGDPSVLGMDLLLERPSPRGTKRRLSSRVLPPAAWICKVLARRTTKRGYLA